MHVRAIKEHCGGRWHCHCCCYCSCGGGDISKGETSSFGGLEVACWPLVPKFAGSHQAEAVGFFRAKKSSARLSLEEK